MMATKRNRRDTRKIARLLAQGVEDLATLALLIAILYGIVSLANAISNVLVFTTESCSHQWTATGHYIEQCETHEEVRFSGFENTR